MTATSVSPIVFSSRFDTGADEISPTPSATDVATSTASTAEPLEPDLANGHGSNRRTRRRASTDDTIRIGAPGAPGGEDVPDRRLSAKESAGIPTSVGPSIVIATAAALADPAPVVVGPSAGVRSWRALGPVHLVVWGLGRPRIARASGGQR